MLVLSTNFMHVNRRRTGGKYERERRSDTEKKKKGEGEKERQREI